MSSPTLKIVAICAILRGVKFWRFFLGAAIGTGMGYTLVLLVLPTLRQPKKPRFETIYQAPVERKEEQPAA